MARSDLEQRRNLRSLAEKALRRRFEELWNEALDDRGRAENLRPLLSPEIGDSELEAARKDIGQGSGGELLPTKKKDGSYRPPPLHSVYGSCGLALNCFAPWRLATESLQVGSHSGFSSLRLEVKLPIRGISESDTPPNLDVGVANDDRVLVIESKLTEYLDASHVATFQEKYAQAIPYAERSWNALYKDLLGEAARKLDRRFQYLHVGQLVRHYLGLASQLAEGGIYAGRRGTLLYLYWEPDDADAYFACRTHREEVEAVRTAVSDPDVPFEAMSYRELWRSWARAESEKTHTHARYLESRYGVPLNNTDPPVA